MDFSQVLAVATGWVVLSVPVSFVIGAFIALGSRAPQPIPVRVGQTIDQAA